MTYKSQISSPLLIAFANLTVSFEQQSKKDSSPAIAFGEFDRNILPILPHPFDGTVDSNAVSSKPDFPIEIAAPKGAPNVIIILTDDVGYGASSTFGGPVATPTFDKLAASGLRYNQFH